VVWLLVCLFDCLLIRFSLSLSPSKLTQIIYSAWMGYGNYGCDVGGYRGNDNTKYSTNFLRSAQLNAFLPLMENGGGGEHRPWMYDEEVVVPVYRKFVNEHYRLGAYLHTNGANSVDSK
jgi:alpha-glucosidase (family GH31 glycosyl hydrolase)